MNDAGLFDLLGPLSAPPCSVYERCIRAVQAKLRTLALPGLRAESVAVRSLPSLRELVAAQLPQLPALIVWPAGREANEVLGATNRHDAIGYLVGVAIVAANDQLLGDRRSLYLMWRQRLVRAFRNQPLAAVSEVLTCSIEPDLVLDAGAWQQNVWYSAVGLRFVARELRGSS